MLWDLPPIKAAPVMSARFWTPLRAGDGSSEAEDLP